MPKTTAAEEKREPQEENRIKIKFSRDETGWAYLLPDGRCRIANVPVCEDLNLGDIVTLEDAEDGWRIWKEVVERKYEEKTAIVYLAPYPETYAKIAKLLHQHDMHAEGLVKGVVVVAHKSGTDPLKLCLENGITNVESFDNSKSY